MRIKLAKVLAHDGVTLGFSVPAVGISFPVTFSPEDATPERDAERGLANPAEGVQLLRRESTVTVISEQHDLQVEIASGDLHNHKITGKNFVVRFLGSNDFELEVS